MSDGHQLARITLSALISARWAVVFLLAGVGVLGELLPNVGADSMRWFDGDGSSPAIFFILIAWSVVNAGTWFGVSALSRFGTLVAGLHLIVDVCALTLLLWLSGGAANPFTLFYLVFITLATQVSPRWTWGVAIASVAAFGLLFEVVPSMGPMHMTHFGQGGHFGGHLKGMWLSLGLAGGLITIFVHRIALRIAEQRLELTNLRAQMRRDKELRRLGGLAAGAAHELGTPLATLAILIGDFERMNDEERSEATRTMTREIARSKRIIASMSSPNDHETVSTIANWEPWTLGELDIEFATIEVKGGDSDVVSLLPKEVLVRILRELVKNAHAAGAEAKDIDVCVTLSSEPKLTCVVRDKGQGMSEEILSSAADPFFSTHQRSENTGLGLFLVEAQVRSFGGQMTIDSTPGDGTQVSIVFQEGKMR